MFPDARWPHVSIEAAGKGRESYIIFTKTPEFQLLQKELEKERRRLAVYEEGICKIKELESLLENQRAIAEDKEIEMDMQHKKRRKYS